MTSHTSSHSSELGLQKLSALLVFAVISLFMLSLVSGSASAPFASSELQFTDTSTGGLNIVPASCASYPHYAGECGVYAQSSYGPGYSQGGYVPDAPSGNACVIALSPSTVIAGGSATMSWNSSYSILGIPFSLTGAISPTPGSVSSSGSTSVSPSATTVYSGTFTPSGSLNGIPASWLTSVTCSARLTVLPSTPGPSRCVQQRFCVGQDVYEQSTSCANTFIERCPFGCSNGVCLGAPAPTGFLRVRPSLLRAGTATTVEWSATSVSSCTVTENNAAISDSWSGADGSQTSSPIPSQTTYTLTCTGLDGSTLGRTAVVNITPIFDEQ